MILILLSGCCINILINALIADNIYLTCLDAFVAMICLYMYSFIFFYLVSSCFSVTCCDLSVMSIVQVAFVNPLVNELCMYVCNSVLAPY